jgi:uncharacterized membrane protein YbaN (DUF454 family)
MSHFKSLFQKTNLRYLFILAGCLAVALGTVGVVLPGLPTTPFVLLASWCFYKGSPRLQSWLLHSFLGKYITDYQQKGGISTKKRIYIILLMAAMVALSTIFFIQSLSLRIIVITAGIIGCIVVAFFVPKAH